MNAFSLVVLPLALGLVGSITPCALGINAVFLGYVMDKDRRIRLWQGSLLALTRAFSLMLLGLLFAFIGEHVKSFLFGYQRLIAFSLIALGALLILNYYRPISLPGLNLGSKRFRQLKHCHLYREYGPAVSTCQLWRATSTPGPTGRPPRGRPHPRPRPPLPG